MKLSSYQTRYLEALTRTRDVEQAMAEVGIDAGQMAKARRQPMFLAREMTALSAARISPGVAQQVHEDLQKDRYIAALREHYANKSEARATAGLTLVEVNKFKANDDDFVTRESEVYEYFADKIEQTAVQQAIGADPPTRDYRATMGMLEKVKPGQYGPAPKVIDHRFTQMTPKEMDDEIAFLLEGGD